MLYKCIYVNYNKMKLHSNIIGEGAPFIILHGFMGMGDNWKTLAKKYNELGFQVHLVDQRNHGRSPHSNDFSYEYMGNDLLEYCNDNNLTDIILLGHSMGGKTAMDFACKNPDLVKKLLIADIAPKYYAPHHQIILESLAALDFNTIASRNDADETLKKYINDAGTRMFLLKNLYRKTKTTFGLRNNLKVLTEKVIEIGKALENNAIFNKPTLFLRGDKSNYILDQDLELIQNHFTNVDLKTVTNASHWLHAENPAEFFEYSSTFIIK